MPWVADMSKLLFLNQELNRFTLARSVDIKHLSRIALELVALRGLYETFLQSAGSGDDRERAERVLKRVQDMERLVARLYMASRLRQQLAQSTFPTHPITAP